MPLEKNRGGELLSSWLFSWDGAFSSLIISIRFELVTATKQGEGAEGFRGLVPLFNFILLIYMYFDYRYSESFPGQ